MYFKKLEIFGFKSFADKTVFNFEPGVTAIIGPNGCGKSNVFDAIRWALGEQSSKELRGTAMEDVIFNGTDKKSALGFAEVSVTMSNESRMLPIEYDEVTVTRRLFRSGESEYLLNKSAMRLKDILELFMGTGIGAEAYSLVQQGKVDLIVSARPEDRRVILDEASGVTKYKAKRKEALSRLADTDNNLLRINDIIIEVKRQISSLERQANKARRYKEEFEKLKNLEVRLADYEIGQFQQKIQATQAQIDQLKADEQSQTRVFEELNERIENENALLEEVDDKINNVNAEEIKLESQIDINNRQIGFNEERIENIDAHVARLKEKVVQLRERCTTEQEKINELNNCLASLDGHIQQKIQSLHQKRGHLQEIGSRIRQHEDVIHHEEESILDVSTRQVQVKNRLTEIMKDIQGALARKRRLEIENNKVSNEKGEVDEKMRIVLQKIEQSTGRIAEMRDQLESKRMVLKEYAAERDQVQECIDDLERRKLFLKSQKEFIEKLTVQYQDIPDPIVEGRLFTTMPPQENRTGIIGKVKQVLPSASQRWEGLRAAFPDHFDQLVEVVCEAKFIELDPQQVSVQIDELSQQIGSKIVHKQDLQTRIDAQTNVIGQIELDIQEEEKLLSVHTAQKNDIADESRKLTEEIDLVHLELDEVNDNLTSSKKTEDELSLHLDELNRGLSASQHRIQDSREAIASLARDREETTVCIAQLETEVSSEEDKRIGYQENLKLFTEEMEGHTEEIGHIESEFSELDIKKEQFGADIEALHQKIHQIKEQKQSLRENLIQFEKQREEMVQKIGQMRVQSHALTKQIDEVREHLHGHQMAIQEVSFKEKEIKDRLMQAYKIDLNQERESPADQKAGEDEYQDPEALRVAIERLRKRCDSFGSVNMVAIDEYEELRERFEFLTKQQSDLITAKESLRETIRKINRQTRQMFMDTFTKVSEEFRIYFRMLFGGGEARLVLLESGIEIIARPPGKKLQNISLLSGGEKTLTAIALIFGVFKVNPSPFCVLDEIDAALDESNVGRFSYLLKDFAKISQFIVITHNKKTIANSDAMYGITMEETGVSKVVSVKFADGNEKAEKPTEQNVPAGV